MNNSPRSLQLFGGRPWPVNTGITFPTSDDFLGALFGAPQQQAHVDARRRALALARQTAALDAADLRVAAHLKTMIARERAR